MGVPGRLAASSGTTGLYHVAVRFPDRSRSRTTVSAFCDAGIPLEGASDHGVSEAIYLRDPDGNGVELYTRPPARGVAASDDGKTVAMFTRPLDLRALLAEAE